MDDRPPSFTPLFLSLLALSFAPLAATSQARCNGDGDGEGVRAGYWFSDSSHHSPISTIDPSLYTHLYYYSLPIDPSLLAPALPPADQVPPFAAFSAALKSANPSLKTLLSVATDDARAAASNAAFSAVAADPRLRSAFINATVELARANAFDGVDLAWRFPASPVDMANLAILLREWRARIEEEARDSDHSPPPPPPPPPLLLTATLYFADHVFDDESAADDLDYPTEAISSYLDWINTLSFGFHENTNFTANHSPLYDRRSHFSASYGITSWIDSGVPPCKLVMGMPLFGRSWFLRNKSKNALGAPAVALGPKQKTSNRAGVIADSEIEEVSTNPSAVFVYDDRAVAAYLSLGNLWASFDSLEVVEKKIEFARSYGLLGYFLWPISFDDSNYTVSKKASEFWIKYENSSEFEGGDGFGRAPPPPPPPIESPPPPSSAAVAEMPLLLLPLLSSILSCLLLANILRSPTTTTTC